MTVITGRAAAWLRKHRRGEEALAEAAGFALLQTLVRRAGLFAAGVAAAAVVASTTGTNPTYHPSAPLSTKGAAFVTRYEGVVLHLYNDPFNCTIGVGHLIHVGPCTSIDQGRWSGFTRAMATTLLIHDAGSATACVHSSVTRAISVPQDDALIDFTFNVGCAGLRSSAVLRDVNAGAFPSVPGALLHWVTANGKYLAGLHTRRVAEGHLFTTGDYGSGIGQYIAPAPKPTPAPQPPKVIPTWAWKWVQWRLGRGAFKHHANAASYRARTGAPAAAPAWAWTFLKRFTKTT